MAEVHEEVAKAICEESGFDPDEEGLYNECRWQDFLGCAYGAVAAHNRWHDRERLNSVIHNKE